MLEVLSSAFWTRLKSSGIVILAEWLPDEVVPVVTAEVVPVVDDFKEAGVVMTSMEEEASTHEDEVVVRVVAISGERADSQTMKAVAEELEDTEETVIMEDIPHNVMVVVESRAVDTVAIMADWMMNGKKRTLHSNKRLHNHEHNQIVCCFGTRRQQIHQKLTCSST